jgi:hypothetical protein
MDKTYLIELTRDMPPLWDQRNKKYFWKKNEKLNVTASTEIIRINNSNYYLQQNHALLFIAYSRKFLIPKVDAPTVNYFS